jgi:hypothetical protein
VKKPNHKGTELTSQVKYGKEERRKWKNSSHTLKKSNYTTVFLKKCNHIKDIKRYERY